MDCRAKSQNVPLIERNNIALSNLRDQIPAAEKGMSSRGTPERFIKGWFCARIQKLRRSDDFARHSIAVQSAQRAAISSQSQSPLNQLQLALSN
jgi:hypothetical protein